MDTGGLLNRLEVHSNDSAILTGSGSIDGDYLYQGVSSLDSVLIGVIPGFESTFAGRMVKIDLKSHTIVWSWDTISQELIRAGFSGAAIWASNPMIHRRSNTIYFGTGQNYAVSDEYSMCMSQAVSAGRLQEAEMCNTRIANHNYFNSIIALDTNTGTLKWAKRANYYDAWNVGCITNSGFNADACPDTESLTGLDYDFGMSPVQVRLTFRNKVIDALVVGQKSGFVFCFGLDGRLIWRVKAGPGGTLGGLSWGLSYDGTYVIATVINAGGSESPKEWTNPITGVKFRSSFWMAIDPNSGDIKWVTEAPMGASLVGPPASTGGVSFVTSISGYVYALDSATGEILSGYDTGVNVYGGFSISDGCVYVGNGYKPQYGYDPGYGETKLHAWCF